MTISCYHDPVTDTTLLSVREMEIRLRVPQDATDVQMIHWNKYRADVLGVETLAMDKWAVADGWAYYRALLRGAESRIRYLQYAFRFQRGGRRYWLNAEGLHDRECRKGAFAFSYAGDRDAVHSPTWVEDRVWYQIFPERFANGDSGNDPEGTVPWGTEPTRDNFMGGDLRGIIHHLDYLQDLGVNALYLNPIFAAKSNHKYDTIDYFAIDPHFGTIDDLKQLVRACHERGIRVVLDLVINHCGYDHPFFQDVVRNGERSPYRDWFYVHEFPVELSEHKYDSVGYYKWMPKFRTSTPQVRQYIFEVVSFWQKEAGIDGWRIDVADEVEISFLRELKSHVMQENHDAFIIAEIWHDAKGMLMARAVDSVMNYDARSIWLDFLVDRTITLEQFHERLVRFLHRYSLKELRQMFNLLGSHDTERILTRCRNRKDVLAQLIALQFVFPGNPVIYYGDEAEMTGENDPGCRGCMPWDSAPSSKPIWKLYRNWIRYRHSSEALRKGAVEVDCAADEGLYLIRRTFGSKTVSLVLNVSGKTLAVSDAVARFGLSLGQLCRNPDLYLDPLSENILPNGYAVFDTE